MKKFGYVATGVILLILASWLMQSDRPSGSPEPEAPATPVSSTTQAPVDLDKLSLKTTWRDPRSNEEWVFTTDFTVPDQALLQAADREMPSNAIPFRITAELDLVRLVGDNRTKERQPGDAHLVVMDSERRVVVQQVASLDSLCPS